jgi:hypothetical protein
MGYPTDDELRRAVGYADFGERLTAVKKLILQTRIEEASGFSHGAEEWSGNMKDDEVQSDSPIYYYEERLKKEIEEL